MHQLKVFRCDVCQAPFLFESSLEDHKRDHSPRVEVDYAFVETKTDAKPGIKKKARTKKRKQKST